MLTPHLSVSDVPAPLILSPLVPSSPLCPLPHLSSPVPITPHRSPTLLFTWAPTFLHTPGLHLAQVHINTYMCICHDELPTTWVHPPHTHTHHWSHSLIYTQSLTDTHKTSSTSPLSQHIYAATHQRVLRGQSWGSQVPCVGHPTLAWAECSPLRQRVGRLAGRERQGTLIYPLASTPPFPTSPVPSLLAHL